MKCERCQKVLVNDTYRSLCEDCHVDVYLLAVGTGGRTNGVSNGWTSYQVDRRHPSGRVFVGNTNSNFKNIL